MWVKLGLGGSPLLRLDRWQLYLGVLLRQSEIHGSEDLRHDVLSEAPSVSAGRRDHQTYLYNR